jgi:hypothetical protein
MAVVAVVKNEVSCPSLDNSQTHIKKATAVVAVVKNEVSCPRVDNSQTHIKRQRQYLPNIYNK